MLFLNLNLNLKYKLTYKKKIVFFPEINTFYISKANLNNFLKINSIFFSVDYNYSYKKFLKINLFFFTIFYRNNIFNSNFFFLLKINFFLNRWSNVLFNYYYIFNCCFYNFYLENNFFFYKIFDTNTNIFY